MSALSTNLVQRLDGVRAYSTGISAEDVEKLELAPALVADILSCLDSTEVMDMQMGLFFSEVLFDPDKLDKGQAAKFVVRLISIRHDAEKQVQAPCLKLLIRFRSSVTNYRDFMLKGLADLDPLVRKEALLAYGTYCHNKEVIPLDAFESDDYLTEISMNGPLIYELRNLALETIERVIGKAFKKSEKAESLEDRGTVFWWDWAPYHAWRKGWSKRFFG